MDRAQKKVDDGSGAVVVDVRSYVIDDLGGISIEEERANRDYDDAMETIEKDIGMEAQRAHGKEQRSSDQRIDLLGATFHIPSETLDVTERFKTKLTSRLLEVLQRGT